MQNNTNHNPQKLKVTNKIITNFYIIQGLANPRYKTTLCKKFSSGQTCPYGDKCQFAHGTQELRLFENQNLARNMMGLSGNGNNKSPNNFINYKIVKCKNWEKDRTCKYGAHCTFAHGDNDLRKKTDNLYQMNPAMSMMMPMMVPPGMDMNQMQQIMLSNQLMMGMGVPGGIPQPSQDNKQMEVDKGQ